jgi:hypothetical protein
LDIGSGNDVLQMRMSPLMTCTDSGH